MPSDTSYRCWLKCRIAAWNDENLDNIPICEPGLDKIVERPEVAICFSTDVDKAIDALFLFR
jgi:hypothetical protein